MNWSNFASKCFHRGKYDFGPHCRVRSNNYITNKHFKVNCLYEDDSDILRQIVLNKNVE